MFCIIVLLEYPTSSTSMTRLTLSDPEVGDPENEPVEFLHNWWNPFFLSLAQYFLCLQLPPNPRAEWIHLHHSWHGVLLYKGFTQTYLLWWWPKHLILVSSVQNTLFQRASGFSMFSFAYFRHIRWYWGRSFWQHCHVGICCLKYAVFLSFEQVDLCLLLFFAALLQWCVGSSVHFSSGLGPLCLKSFLVFQTLP